MPCGRAPDCSLDSRRAYAAGYSPADLTVALRRMAGKYLKAKDAVCGRGAD